MGLKGKFGFV